MPLGTLGRGSVAPASRCAGAHLAGIQRGGAGRNHRGGILRQAGHRRLAPHVARALTVTYEELVANGVETTQEPTEQPYGVDCAIRDPFGNHIRITQPAKQVGDIAEEFHLRAADSASS